MTCYGAFLPAFWHLHFCWPETLSMQSGCLFVIVVVAVWICCNAPVMSSYCSCVHWLSQTYLWFESVFFMCGICRDLLFTRKLFFSNLTWVFFSWQSLCAFSLSKDRSFSVHKSGSGFKLVITFSWSWVCGRGSTMAVNILQIHWSNQNFQITGGVIAMTRLVVKKITSFLYGLLIFRP